MKKVFPIFLCLLLCSSCIRDDLSLCPGKMYFHFTYLYGGVNRFFEQQKADMTFHFYHVGETMKYREMTVMRRDIGPQQPFIFEKTPSDIDSVEIISWSADSAIEYVGTPRTPKGEGYVQLKEMTEGSGICLPVDDLFYGYVKLDARRRLDRNHIIMNYVRPVCRIRITMVPSTLQNRDSTSPGAPPCAGSTLLPGAEDYAFHVHGTPDRIDDNTVPGGRGIILSPRCAYQASSGNIVTGWFGAFPTLDGECLKVNVYIRDRQVAVFDCAPLELASKAGNFYDLVIDGRYIRPQMEVKVNGWKIATVMSEM